MKRLDVKDESLVAVKHWFTEPEIVPGCEMDDDDWEYVSGEIEAMLESDEFDWAKDTLEGILESVVERKYVSPAQIKAVNNIRTSKDWDYL